jgi:hypothetical protein
VPACRTKQLDHSQPPRGFTAASCGPPQPARERPHSKFFVEVYADAPAAASSSRYRATRTRSTRGALQHTSLSWSVAKTPQRDALKTLRDIGGVSAMLVRRAQGPPPAVSGSPSAVRSSAIAAARAWCLFIPRRPSTRHDPTMSKISKKTLSPVSALFRGQLGRDGRRRSPARRDPGIGEARQRRTG